jgi:hypothetical protein
LDEASCYNDLGNNNCHLRRSQNSYNATYDYEKFYSRGFPATEEVDGEQKEGDVDAYDPSQGRGCTRPAVEQERNLAAYQNRQLSDLWYSTTHPHFQQKLHLIAVHPGIPFIIFFLDE